MAKDPYAGSNYDAAGMPLATTTVDYDNAEEVRLAMVKDKVVEPQNHVYDIEYTAKQVEGVKPFVSDAELNKAKDEKLAKEAEEFALDLDKLEDKDNNDGKV